MGQNSAIEWTSDTWNPWQGCRKVSAGCKFCYMYRDKQRYGQDPAVVTRSSPQTFNAPLKTLHGPLIFTCSWSDFFIEEADPWRNEAWDIIWQTPHLTYQILTKRPENIARRLPNNWGNGWPNVWLGVSVEDQAAADTRIPILLNTPAAVRFLSCEPLLEKVGLSPYLRSLQWVIAGGESGYTPRPADPAWFRAMRDQCQAADVPFFFKQHGGSRKVDGVWGGRELDWRTWDEMPEAVWVRQ